jgi:FKBP-type peptidyl-prolyl cis-trans isomerase
MKILNYLTVSLFAAFSFASCGDNPADDAWKNANTEAYNKIAADTAEYKDVRKFLHGDEETGPFGVYFKELKKGGGTEYPLQTSSVEVLYSGKYYNGTYFDTGTEYNGVPVTFSVGSTIRGFAFALQNMAVGDKWEIVIPYFLGYGATDYYNSATGQIEIQGYTTLFFEVELVSITTYPE